MFADQVMIKKRERKSSFSGGINSLFKKKPKPNKGSGNATHVCYVARASFQRAITEQAVQQHVQVQFQSTCLATAIAKHLVQPRKQAEPWESRAFRPVSA